MSEADRHSILLVAEIHVASLGADQLSFGAIRPPMLAIVVVIWAWRSGKVWVGSGRVVEVELLEEVVDEAEAEEEEG